MLESIKRDRDENVKVYLDNEVQIKTWSVLQENILDCFHTTELHITTPRVYTNAGKQNVTVTNSSALMEAVKFDKAVILNFASAVHPGGGYIRGANAQEECLCRSSTLYNVLEKFSESFYIPNRQLDLTYTDSMFYTPNVIFFKDDFGNSLPEYRKFNVITAAAPNNRTKWISDEKLQDIFLRRIQMVFAVAAKHGQRNIIVGAWGCGAFGCNPEIVSKAFRAVLSTPEAKSFDNIVFAVLDNHKEELVNVFRKNIL
jgi:uncharacterized protein (TIGR02452 family)